MEFSEFRNAACEATETVFRCQTLFSEYRKSRPLTEVVVDSLPEWHCRDESEWTGLIGILNV